MTTVSPRRALTDMKAAPIATDATLVRAVENAPVAIYYTDATGNITYVNPAYRRVFGLTPEQSVNEEWAPGVHPDDRARMQEAWADFCRRPRPVRFEYRTETSTGGVRFFAEQVVATEGDNGFVGTITDITDLVAARGDLRRVETLFRNTFEQAPIGIAYADRNGRFVHCNPAFCTMLGFELDELENKTHRRTHLRRGHRRAAAASSRASGAVEIGFVDVEKRYIRKDGSILWVRVTTALVREGSAATGPVGRIPARYFQPQADRGRVIAATDAARGGHHRFARGAAGMRRRRDRSRTTIAPRTSCCCLRVHGCPLPVAPHDPPPLARQIYLADGVTPVSRTDHALARALRGETVSNLELVIVPRGAIAAYHPVERAAAGRSRRADCSAPSR